MVFPFASRNSLQPLKVEPWSKYQNARGAVEEEINPRPWVAGVEALSGWRCIAEFWQSCHRVIYCCTGFDGSDPCSQLDEVIFRNTDWILKRNAGRACFALSHTMLLSWLNLRQTWASVMILSYSLSTAHCSKKLYRWASMFRRRKTLILK